VTFLVTQNLAAIVMRLTGSVKDASRRCAVAAQSLTAPFRPARQ